MRALSVARIGCLRPRVRPVARPGLRRPLLTLAIETSCDDTSVAILERHGPDSPRPGRAELHFHKKVTSDNTKFGGVYPLVALQSHQENLALLVSEAIPHLRGRTPDFVSVTRGPGMRSNLFTGVDTAKGLAVAWQKPLVGVHHMQAHALTPRLVHALQPDKQAGEPVQPEFPFLSILASGGHTLLIHSASLTQHDIMASTVDIAVGDHLDKAARMVLPPSILDNAEGTMYGALLERFAFSPEPPATAQKSVPEASEDRQKQTSTSHLEDNTANRYRDVYSRRYDYKVPKNLEEDATRKSKWGWSFRQPFARTRSGVKNNPLAMSFSGLSAAVERAVQYQYDPATGKPSKAQRLPQDISIAERKDMAREAMRAAFEHIASRVVAGLKELSRGQSTPVNAVVMAGGVAANTFLRYILASTLCAHGYSDIRVVFPPPSFCTDNAAMIAWAGLEMYEAGYADPLSIRAIRQWPLDQLLSPPQENHTR